MNCPEKLKFSVQNPNTTKNTRNIVYIRKFGLELLDKTEIFDKIIKIFDLRYNLGRNSGRELLFRLNFLSENLLEKY